MDHVDDITLTRSLEERLVNVWPAVTTLMMDGWVVRFANGYSGRANSASALVPGATVNLQFLTHIEALYRAEGLKPQFRISPLAGDGVEAFLLAQGYRVKDEAQSMTVTLTTTQERDARVHIASAPDDAWLNGISVRQEPSKRSPAHLLAIVSRVKLPYACATLRENGTDLGFAYSAIDRGFAEIGLVMVDEKARGNGLGRAIMTSLMQWAATQGATHAFLQVDANNTPALRLYESLGFRRAYRYRTLVKDQG